MHSYETKNKAFALYCSGVVPNKIANLLGLRDETAVYRWVQKYNWEEKRKEILKLKEESASLTDREQDLKIVESVLAIYAIAMKQQQNKMLDKLNYKDVFEAVKLRRLLKGESTENIKVNSEVMSVKDEVKKILEGNNE